MLYAGLTVGLYFSVDSAARRLFAAGRWLSFFMDLIFGAAAALITLLALLLASDGELRLYALMGVVCGFLIYMGTFAPLISKLLSLTARGSRAALSWLSRRKLIKKLLK